MLHDGLTAYIKANINRTNDGRVANVLIFFQEICIYLSSTLNVELEATDKFSNFIYEIRSSSVIEKNTNLNYELKSSKFTFQINA